MVVGMQHQQQQPHASPATVLEDATTPCAVSSLLAPTSLTTSLAKKNKAQEKDPNTDNKRLLMPKTEVSESSLIVDTAEVKRKNEVQKTSIEVLKTFCSDPIRSTGRVKLRDVNPHLVCVLCHGYFVDATSIAECLHSFCRSCIILYLATKNYCPICEVQINSSKPHLSLKPDKALQDIVYKLVPGLFYAEMKRRHQFYQDYPNRDLDLHPEYRGITVDRLVYSPLDNICISLVYYDKSKEREEWENVTSRVPVGTAKSTTNSDSDGDDDLPKRYLMCPAAVRVMDLKKLIRMKYSLVEENKVELLFRKESLPDDYSLMDIAYIYAWKRNSPMQLYYTISIMTAVSVQSTELKAGKEVSSTSTSNRLTPTYRTFNSKSSRLTSALDISDTNESCQTESIHSVGTSKSRESFTEAEKSSNTAESSVPAQATPTSVSGGNETKSKNLSPLPSLSSQDRDVKLNEIVSRTEVPTVSQSEIVLSIPTAIPMSTITTVVHSTPRISTKSKGTHGVLDMKNCKEKSSVRCSSNADTSPIKSYLAISSILNEKDKLNTKKTLLFTKKSDKKVSMTESNQVPVPIPNVTEIAKCIPSAVSTTIPAEICPITVNEKNKSDVKKVSLLMKNSFKKIAMSESNQTAILPSNLLKQTKSSSGPSSTSSKVPVANSSPKSVKSLSSIVKSLTTTACPVVGKENHKVVESTKGIDAPNKSTNKERVLNSNPGTDTNCNSSSSSIVISSNKNVPAAFTSTTSLVLAMQVKTCSAKQTLTTVTTNTTSNLQISSSVMPKCLTSVSSGNSTRLKQLPKLLPAPANSTPTDVKSSILPPPASTHSVINHGISKTRSPTPVDSTPTTTASINKDMKFPFICSASSMMTAKTTSISTVPPLITLSSTGVHTSLTNVNSSPKKNNSRSTDPVNSFILSTNAKIPSSLEISLTQPRNTSNVLPMNNLQKIVPKNFQQTSNTLTSSHQKPNNAVKRSFVNSREDGPSEKYIAFMSKTKNDDKQSFKPQLQKDIIDEQKNDTSDTIKKNTPPKKVFSPDILPEVSITLNPNPESVNKRLSPETSYDVSCFKPLGVSNGIPPLTPINTSHSATQNQVAGTNNNVGSNILKSPSNQSLIYSLKSTSQCSSSRVEDIEKHSDVAKRPRLENGECKLLSTQDGRHILKTEKALPGSSKSTIASAKKDGGSKPAAIPTKKDGTARHQGIPKLININAPFAKSRLKFASMRPNLTTPNFPPDTMTSNLWRQQQWIFNMNCPIPPHPLMNQFTTGKPSVSQDTIPSNTSKK